VLVTVRSLVAAPVNVPQPWFRKDWGTVGLTGSVPSQIRVEVVGPVWMLTDWVVVMNWGGAAIPHRKPRVTVVADAVRPADRTPWSPGRDESIGLGPTVESWHAATASHTMSAYTPRLRK
jgi:hypothetical protein